MRLHACTSVSAACSTIFSGLALAISVIFSASSSQAVVVTLDSGNTTSIASYAGVSQSAQDVVQPSSFPVSDTLNAVSGIDTSTTAVSLTNTAFSIDMTHSRDSAFNHWAKTEGFVYFSVDQDVDYEATGSYSVLDGGGSGANVQLYGVLQDLTAANDLFFSDQQSGGDPNESFTLGLSEGSVSNFTVGSLTGTLLAGHDYVFAFGATSANVGFAASGTVSGSGNITLTFIPEPSTALLLGLGLVGLSKKRKRAVAL